MRELLVVVLEVGAQRVRAALAEVDRPGEVVRETVADRRDELAADVRGALQDLRVEALSLRLLALAVAVHDGVPDAEASALRAALRDELPDGWGLPAALPVVRGSATTWARAGAPVPSRPTVAGAVVAAARAVGAHAHLPAAPGQTSDSATS